MNTTEKIEYGLNTGSLEKIRTVFKSFSEIEEVIIYGSRAKGEFKNGSDIDLAFVGKNLSNNKLSFINNKLDDLMLPYTIDTILLKNINNSDLIEHIKRVGKVFFRKESN